MENGFLEDKHKLYCEAYRAEVQSLRSDKDDNEGRDTPNITGRYLPVASQNEISENIVKSLHNEVCVTVDLNDISIAHRIGPKPACKQIKPSFYVNCSLTPTRNKVQCMHSVNNPDFRQPSACR